MIKKFKTICLEIVFGFLLPIWGKKIGQSKFDRLVRLGTVLPTVPSLRKLKENDLNLGVGKVGGTISPAISA